MCEWGACPDMPSIFSCPQSHCFCLAAANSAKRLMALSAVNPQSNQHSLERLWSLPWDKLPGYGLCEYSMYVLSSPGKHISCNTRLPVSNTSHSHKQPVIRHAADWALMSISQCFLCMNVETESWSKRLELTLTG